MSIQWKKQRPKRPECSLLTVTWAIGDWRQPSLQAVVTSSFAVMAILCLLLKKEKKKKRFLFLQLKYCSEKRSRHKKWTVKQYWTFVHVVSCKQHSRQGELTAPVPKPLQSHKNLNYSRPFGINLAFPSVYLKLA